MSVRDGSFEALRAEIARDLEPVRPLRLGRRLFPILAILVLVLFAILQWEFGASHSDGEDAGKTAEVWLWGLTLLELGAAVGLFGLSLREVIPASRSSGFFLTAALAGAVVLQLGACWVASWKIPVRVPEGRELDFWIFCLCQEVLLALPVGILVAVFVRRGVVTSRWRVGLLVGLGAGLIADGLWRLMCPYTDLAHAVTSHGGGVLSAVLLGLALAFAWDRLRLRDFRARHETSP